MIRQFACLVLLFAGFVGVADAQYQWRDARGRMVFSDIPPPAGTPAERIIRAPAPPRTTSADAASAAGMPSPDAAATSRAGAPGLQGKAIDTDIRASAAPAYKDKAMAFEKRRQERAEEEAKAAQLAREAADKTRYCGELEAQRRTLASGGRIASVGADGQRRYLDEAGRKARLDENARALAATCKG